MNAIVTICKVAGTPGHPTPAYHVEVRKPNGGLIDGTWGFLDIEKARAWGRSKARSAGFPEPDVKEFLPTGVPHPDVTPLSPQDHAVYLHIVRCIRCWRQVPSQREIAHALGVSANEIYRSTAALERCGLVVRPGGGKGRVKLI